MRECVMIAVLLVFFCGIFLGYMISDFQWTRYLRKWDEITKEHIAKGRIKFFE